MKTIIFTTSIKTSRSFRLFALAGAMLLLLTAAPNRAHARFVLTLTQVGGNVMVDGSGSINTSALTILQGASYGSLLNPSGGNLFDGAVSAGAILFYNGGGITGPASFGSGGNVFASSGTGILAGVSGGYPAIVLASGYVSGSAIADTSTYTGQTFASLGFTPGTYTYTWGTGLNADSLVITSVVPEPSTWAVLLGGVGLLLAGQRWRRSCDV